VSPSTVTGGTSCTTVKLGAVQAKAGRAPTVVGAGVKNNHTLRVAVSEMDSGANLQTCPVAPNVQCWAVVRSSAVFHFRSPCRAPAGTVTVAADVGPVAETE